jgi:glycerophosphoryl diester phosphodiesterase
MKAVFVLLFLCGSMVVSAQGGRPQLVLDRYVIDSNGQVGTLQCLGCTDTENPSFKIKKGARWFRMTKANQLELKRSKNKGRDRYGIEVQANVHGEKVSNQFVIITDSFIRNKVIAHRGAWKNTATPENSVASLQAAFDLGCEGSEFDVHLSADSVLFVYHDAKVGNVYIEKSDSAALRKLALSNGEPLPLVTDFLKAGMRQQKTKLVLELKPSVVSKERSLLLARKVVQAVKEAKAEAWITYISFNYDILKEILRLDPYAKCAYLMGDHSPSQLAADKMFGFDYNLGNLQKNKTWIQQAKQLGLTTNVWTVNAPEQMDYFLAEGIDYITTDQPEILLQKVAAPKTK